MSTLREFAKAQSELGTRNNKLAAAAMELDPATARMHVILTEIHLAMSWLALALEQDMKEAKEGE